MEEGTVLTVVFKINGQSFTALNGGPIFKFSEAFSLQVFCENQEEIDFYWNSLTEGGEEGQCGWCKDKFGLSWQIVPTILPQLMTDPARAGRVTQAFMQMKKFDIEKLKQA
jgi:predicted 3-demethylubiquinone-9 3-methyltransferase (glyoxalase superfamily)